ncbi:MAG: tetratricopeptide repeat protein [Burkholderiales bacterium]|nr:tetratricopeptide repeat protein [Burkholderiales bacterium]
MRRTRTHPLRRAAAAAFLCAPLLVGASGAAAQDIDCGNPFVNHFGPFDYRTATQENKNLVEATHFTPDTEQLKKNSGTGYPGQDIGYTLHVFPNHPRALIAMSRLAIREHSPHPKYAKYSINCYFTRAIQFRPDDGEVYMIYGVHLLKTGAADRAIAQLTKAVELNEASANAQYNLGLAYVEVKDYDKALVHAQKAYALGFPLPGLRNMLQKMGKWQTPVAATDSAQGASGSTPPGRPAAAN